MLLKLAARQQESFMPPDDNTVGAKSLSPQELGLIKLWIDQGAKGEVKGISGAPDWQPLPAGVNPIYSVTISPDGQYPQGLIVEPGSLPGMQRRHCSVSRF